jgi:zinc/manganese transport system substrate-binding protein
MRKILINLLVVALTGSATSYARIKVVASTSDLKSITEYIGGDHVSVKAIVSGKSNPHFVEVLPSYMVMVARADLYLSIGLELDYWAKPIIDGSRNGRLVIVDCSEGIDVLEKPTVKVDASMGDVHPQGNPHYWLDPENGLVIARNIERALSRVDPSHSTDYRQALKSFEQEMDLKMSIWRRESEYLKDLEIIAYHNSWPYFAKAFEMRVVGFVEPRPGIEPTPSHTAELIEMIRARGVKLIVKEPYYSDRTPLVIARATSAKVVNLPLSVGGTEAAADYFSLFETIFVSLRSMGEDAH